MISSALPFFIVTLIIIGLHPAAVNARDSVTWLEAIAPPFFIHEGNNKGQGYESWFGYVACSKTPWGKKLIEKINRILLEQRPTKQYRSAYERWLDKSSLESYRDLYKNVFLQVTMPAENK